MPDKVNAAIARLAAFRASWNDGDEIDEGSHLTAADLDVLLGQLRLEAVEWARAASQK